MQVLLIKPPFETYTITPPLGLGYLTSYLNHKGISARLIDLNLKKYKNLNLKRYLKEEKPSLIGLSIPTSFYIQSLDFIKKIKRSYPVKIVVGGPHPTALPELTLKNPHIDFVLIGEAEETLLELVNNLHTPEKYKGTKGLGFKKNNKIIINPLRPLIKDLDKLPFPAWEDISPEDYPKAVHGAMAKNYPVAQIITSRGCPYNCTFCASPKIWRRKIRFRSPKNVVDEIEYLIENHNIKEIHFEDDNFTFYKRRAMEICQEIIDKNIKISWSCPNGVRVDRVDLELLKKMKQSGCYCLIYGIESGDEEIRKKMNKRISLEKIRDIINMSNKLKIRTAGFFIFGFPGETLASMKKTLDFALSLPLDRAQFNFFTPLPGSEEFDKWAKNKNLEEIDWSKFDVEHAVFIPEGLTKKDLEKFYKKSFIKFYLRPKIMVNLLRDMHLGELFSIIKRNKAIYFN